jgi:dephospho-CoA kinase
MKSHTKKIAITGSIGSGKSTFCKILSGKGYTVINGDELSKELLASNEEIRNKIIKTFGNESFINNEINKKYLAEKAFSSTANVQKINSIIHPVVVSEIKTIFDEKEGKEKIIFVEAALIYEADMEGIFDNVVLVTADENVRKERKVKNGNMTAEEFEKRNANQIPDSEKKKRADFVFGNNSSFDDLKNKAELLIILLTSKTK